MHIRPGPAGGGLAESCGNALALNAVEILPCAERAALHMGARPLKTDILEEPRNHAENSEPARAGVTLQCATPPHGPGRTPRGRPRSRQMKQYPRNRPGKNPTRPAAALRQNPAGSRAPRETAPSLRLRGARLTFRIRPDPGHRAPRDGRAPARHHRDRSPAREWTCHTRHLLLPVTALPPAPGRGGGGANERSPHAHNPHDHR